MKQGLVRMSGRQVLSLSFLVAFGSTYAQEEVWTKIWPPGTTSKTIRAITADPLAPGRIYVGIQDYGAENEKALMRSTDSGTTWFTTPSTCFTTGYFTTIACDPQIPGTVYLGHSTLGVFKSENYGSDWTAINGGLTQPYPLTRISHQNR